MSPLRIVFLLLLICTTALQAETFPKGSESSQVWDYGKALNERSEIDLRQACSSFQEEQGTKIWVVTISGLAKYGAEESDINGYAKRFFRERLTKYGGDDESVLVLLSKEDRKCRIQLGPAWGHGWDRDCAAIMTKGVKSFKERDYADGLNHIVYALNNLATRRKGTSPASLALADWGGRLTPYSPLPSVAILPSVLVAVLLFLGGLFSRSPGTTGLVGIGFVAGLVVLFGGAVMDFFTSEEVHSAYKLAAVLVLSGVAKLFGLDSRSGLRRDSGYSSGSSGGGSSSGGDGGATGSW